VARPTVEPIDPAGLPAATGTYTHGTLVTGAARLRDGTRCGDIRRACSFGPRQYAL